MNTELFISKQLLSSKDKRNNISGPIVKIAVISIALSLAIMIISVAILTGFKTEIKNKLIGFASHIQIVNYDSNLSYETIPINKDQNFCSYIDSIPGINHIQVYAIKAGIIKTGKERQGIVLKGISSDYNWSFFDKYIIKGNNFIVNDSIKSNKILISNYIASLLKLSVNDTIAMFFIQKPIKIRMRKFVISGIYNTNYENFDKVFALVDIAHIQRLENWNKNQISGFEITIDDFDKLDEYTELINNIVGYEIKEDGPILRVMNIIHKYPEVFDWLNIVDTNVWVILILLLLVSSINMISCLLIMILERTNMIGLLKALGCKNSSVRKIFLYLSGFLVNKGIIWGNLIGILICIIQKYFGIIKLDSTTYFLKSVPINLNIFYIIILNIGTLSIIITMLIIPTLIISKISPDKTIKFN